VPRSAIAGLAALLAWSSAVSVCAGLGTGPFATAPGVSAVQVSLPASRPAGRVSVWNAALAPDGAGVASLQRLAPGARRLESPHYVLIHDWDEADAAALARRLELLYAAYARFVDDLHVPARPPTHKLNVCALASWSDLHAALLRDHPGAAATTLGYFDPQRDAVFLCDLETCPEVAEARKQVATAEGEQRPRLERRVAQRLEWLRGAVWQHECAHQLLENTGVLSHRSAPTWLYEGTAMLFEVPLGEDGALANVNAYRLFEYRKLRRPSTSTSAPVARVPAWLWAGVVDPAGPDYPGYWALAAYMRVEYPDGYAALLRQAAKGELPGEPEAQRALLERLFGKIDEAWMRRCHERVWNWPVRGGDFDQ